MLERISTVIAVLLFAGTWGWYNAKADLQSAMPHYDEHPAHAAECRRLARKFAGDASREDWKSRLRTWRCHGGNGLALRTEPAAVAAKGTAN